VVSREAGQRNKGNSPLSATLGKHDDDELRPGSERNFGLVFTAAFAVIGLLPLLGGRAPRLWPLAVAAAFLAVTLVRPAMLAPLNRLWFRFGLLLNRVVNPIVMALLFFVTVTPIALVMRALGKDPLRLKSAPGQSSYWIVRDPVGPRSGSFKDQF
jgi:saxitoxin biosynthesis operon SxtJ-like protein